MKPVRSHLRYLLGSVPLGNTGGGDFTYARLVRLMQYLAANALLLGGIAAMAAFVFYGLRMVQARDNPTKFNDAKKALIKAALGAALIFGVYTVINTVFGAAQTLRE